MSWAEVSKINSDFMEIPLDKRLDLADYKMYGEKSHVFQNKDRLHSLYECTGLTMNDLAINSETLEYFIKKNKVGAAFASVYSIEQFYSHDGSGELFYRNDDNIELIKMYAIERYWIVWCRRWCLLW